MSISLPWKIGLGFAVVALFTAGLVAIFIRISTNDQLTRLILEQERSQIEENLVEYYTRYGSWDNITENWSTIQTKAIPLDTVNNPSPSTQPDQLVNPSNPANSSQPAFPEGAGNPGPDNGDRILFGLADANNIVLVSVDPKYPEGSHLSKLELNNGEEILVNDVQVGTMLMASQLPSFNPEEARFLERTNQALLLAIFGAMVAALVVGTFITRSLTRPLKELTNAVDNISRGQLEQQVSVSSRDEIGQLALAFNRMSQEVAKGNNIRRQMTADIAHDLRTPLTVIGGYIESMRDGVLQPTPQRLSLIYNEIERMQNLVGDLRTLSQVDAGELPLTIQNISPVYLLEHAAELFQHHARQNGVELSVLVDQNLPPIQIDEARMMQVMDNLISNALRYTPSGGRIRLEAHFSGASSHQIEILVSDSGSGINPDELPLVFDRFYRADKSRHNEKGESGLGLAIVKAFVEAQKGHVWVKSEPMQGTTFYIAFPAYEG